MNSHYCVWFCAYDDEALGREYQVNGPLKQKNEMDENLALNGQ
jgi:hypothetical protein